MPSNLPPGCSSPDGGIDHAMESALEELCEKVDTLLTAKALTFLAPLISELLTIAFTQGVMEGEMREQQKHHNEETAP